MASDWVESRIKDEWGGDWATFRCAIPWLSYTCLKHGSHLLAFLTRVKAPLHHRALGALVSMFNDHTKLDLYRDDANINTFFAVYNQLIVYIENDQLNVWRGSPYEFRISYLMRRSDELETYHSYIDSRENLAQSTTLAWMHHRLRVGMNVQGKRKSLFWGSDIGDDFEATVVNITKQQFIVNQKGAAPTALRFRRLRGRRDHRWHCRWDSACILEIDLKSDEVESFKEILLGLCDTHCIFRNCRPTDLIGIITSFLDPIGPLPMNRPSPASTKKRNWSQAPPRAKLKMRKSN